MSARIDVLGRRRLYTLENLNREFRRRMKAQASFSIEEGAVMLLNGWWPSDRSSCARSAVIRHVSELFAAFVAASA